MEEKFKLHIDSISYKDKKFSKNQEEMKKLKYRLQGTSLPVEVTLKELLEAIQEGKAVSPAVMKGTKAEDFVEQQVFMVDIDNRKTDIPLLTVEEAISICKKNHLPLAFYYYSFSHTEKIPKYRLVFVMDKVIRDTSIRLMIIQSLIALFKQADTSCTNADRLFFGTNKKAVICNLESRVTVDNVLNSVEKIVEDLPCAKIPKKYKSELDILKEEFDFFSYLKARKKNGEVKYENSRYAMFEKCEVCGHKDDLIYFKNTNSFYCFGASGNKGGSIIDYLIAVDKLSVSNAIKKLKEDLCGIEKVPKSISLKELLEMDIEPPHVVVENMLYQGLTILAGAPKVGKSWLCLDLGISLGNGTLFLGQKTNKCGCLYLALEDSYYRLQERAKKVLKEGDTIPKDFRLKLLASPLNEGLLEELQEELKENPNTKLIIIDTLQKIRGTISKADTMYGYDYKEMTKIKSFADEHKICILVIHHLKKGNEDDTFDKINGTTGLRGAADTTIILSKIKNKKEVKFSIEGRDVESNEKLLLFNKETFKWEVICSDLEALDTRTDIEIYNSDPVVITIKKLLEEKPEGFEIASINLREKIKEITKTEPEQPNAQTLTRYIREQLQAKLSKYDNIYYKPPSKDGGNKGRKMFFSKPKVEK